jgi:SAM-dependent methyltransferase
MEYDPVKDRLEALIVSYPLLRRLLFLILRHVFLREMEVRRRLRQLKEQGLRPTRILDAGTGFGQYTLYLRRLFPEAHILSVDIKQGYLDNMERFCRDAGLASVDFRYQDLLELSAHGEFDLILNVDVMEHIRDDVRVFQRFRRALTPGGVLVLHTPAVAEGRSLDEVEFREGSYSVGEHVREGYMPSMMRERLTRAGFGRVELKATYGFWGGIAWRLLVRWPMAALSAGFLLAPLVALWMILMFLPARLCNAIEVSRERERGGCMLVTARP